MAVKMMWSVVTCDITGVTRTRLNRSVTCSGALFEAGFTALHPPSAIALYSPPGAFIGGVFSTPPGGCGSVAYSSAALAAGAAVAIGPRGQGAGTRSPDVDDPEQQQEQNGRDERELDERLRALASLAISARAHGPCTVTCWLAARWNVPNWPPII